MVFGYSTASYAGNPSATSPRPDKAAPVVGPSFRAEGEGWIEVGKKGKGKAVTEDSWALLACAEASPSVCNAKKQESTYRP